MIRNLPQRLPELGRLRLGEKGEKGQPVKLATWRATSHDRSVLEALAAIYGGTVDEWGDAPDGDQWQVTTDVAAIDVLVPPDPLFTAYERWGKGGCQRRCDGETCTVVAQGADGGQLVEEPCWCAQKALTPGDADSIKKGACDLVVRLKVVLPDVPGLGAWMVTSGSVYAAMELPAQVALLAGLAERGTLVPATVAIEQRRERKAWERYDREYGVVVLRVRRSLHQLAAGAGRELVAPGTAGALGPARESSRPSTISHFAPHVRSVVITCSELGLTDQQRHALCYAASKGRVSSSKDLTVAEATAVLTALADGSWEALAAAAGQPSTVYEAPAAPPGDGGQPDGEKPAGVEANRQGVIDAQSSLDEHKRPFIKADETLVGPKWERNVRDAARLNGFDDDMLAAVARHGTDGRTHVLRGVLKTEAEAVAAAFVALRDGTLVLVYSGDDGTPSLAPKPVGADTEAPAETPTGQAAS